MTKISIRLTNVLIATVIVLVPFYAFLTVWASSLVGHFTLLRLWDDILLLILVCVVGTWIISNKQLRQLLFNSLLFRLIVAYVLITLTFGVISLTKHEVTLKALSYAVLVNLRFLIWFLAVWMVSIKSSWLDKKWRKLIFWPLAVVAVFALLQFFILPHNFLTHFGYRKGTTFVPIITINQNTNTIRVQSFLRGTNPFGAYLVAMLGLLVACVAVTWRRCWQYLLLVALAIGALILSFSRSAWIGSFVAIVVAAWLSLRNHRTKLRFVVVASVAVLILAIGAVLFQHNNGVQDALFHVSPGSTAQVTSNAGHASSLRSGLHDLLHQPFGRGPGTAGPASRYNAPHAPRNTESYFLEIAEELGWIGLVLFASINIVLGYELWKRRTNPLALGLLASLIGLTIVNQFTYAWSDDTLAFVWWGLAGIALASTVKPHKAVLKIDQDQKVKNHKSPVA
ncbi:MAG TPA: O-antigen ligase family protein [Candidatus Saccharimonadales bacterium]|nr:O-antigen ligase family protein [Candidatus Saccharimonadales bacterium]